MSAPRLQGREGEYVRECLETNWVSSAGPFVDRFEREFCAYLGARYAVATASGTAALHLALLAAGIQPGDEVLVPALSFIAPANAVRYVGAWPVFIDAEPEFWQMDPALVWDFLRRDCSRRRGRLINQATGRRVRAILPVHLLGHPADMDPLREAARKFELVLIEDAAESLGARYKGRLVGTLSEAACFSFNGNKVITTGGGGMMVTNNEELSRRARYLSTQAKDDPAEYIHHEVGYNYRLTNLQAALGCAQMEKLAEHLAAKRRLAENYRAGLADVPGLAGMPEAPWAKSTSWLYTLRVDEEAFGLGRRELQRRLAGAGIQTRPLWQPLHLSPAHQGAWSRGCPVAEKVWAEALSLPSSVGLSPRDQAYVMESLRAARG